MAKYRAIKIVKGAGGFGGPLTIKPTEKKHKVLYITGGGAEPSCLKKIIELSGMEAVNGFKTSIPDEEIALAIIDCGGTLRCGIYPKKRIPTVNTNPVGKSGPMAQFITEDIYVSGVKPGNVSLADKVPAKKTSTKTSAAKKGTTKKATTKKELEKKPKYSTDKKISETMAENKKRS